jgi:peroxiredoxin Q/BCP
MPLEPGTAAPDFTLPDQTGEPVTLSALQGQNVVLYFYPKADTPGCTTQACGVRDHQADYASHDAVVLGVSPDATKKIAKIGPDGTIKEIFRKVRPAEHDDLVLTALAA